MHGILKNKTASRLMECRFCLTLLYHLRSWKGAMAEEGEPSQVFAIIPSEELEGCNGGKATRGAESINYTI